MSNWTCTGIAITIAAISEPVTLEEAIAYMHASPSDASRISLITVGCRYEIEKRLGRSLVEQTIKGTYQTLLPAVSLLASKFDTMVPLLQSPVRSISLVEVLTGSNEWTTQDTSMYYLLDNHLVFTSTPAFFAVDRTLTFRVTYVVGPETIDPADKGMLLQYIAHRYLIAEDDTLPETLVNSIARAKEWIL